MNEGVSGTEAKIDCTYALLRDDDAGGGVGNDEPCAVVVLGVALDADPLSRSCVGNVKAGTTLSCVVATPVFALNCWNSLF